MQGVKFEVYLHQSRALTEKKQQNPEKVYNPQVPTNRISSLYADTIDVEFTEGKESRLGGHISVDLHDAYSGEHSPKGKENCDNTD